MKKSKQQVKKLKNMKNAQRETTLRPPLRRRCAMENPLTPIRNCGGYGIDVTRTSDPHWMYGTLMEIENESSTLGTSARTVARKYVWSRLWSFLESRSRRPSRKRRTLECGSMLSWTVTARRLHGRGNLCRRRAWRSALNGKSKTCKTRGSPVGPQQCLYVDKVDADPGLCWSCDRSRKPKTNPMFSLRLNTSAERMHFLSKPTCSRSGPFSRATLFFLLINTGRTGTPWECARLMSYIARVRLPFASS